MLRLLLDRHGEAGGVTRDRKGQTFMPGFLTAVWHTPVISEGQLPGGGDLFAACARAVESAQIPPRVCDCTGGCSRAHAAICPRCAVSQITDRPDEKA
jgi:hypothetical protein